VRRYTTEMLVPPGSPLAGKSIEAAGLRQLPGLYLIEIERDGQIIPAVSSQEVLRDGDRLVFAGIVDSVMDLQRIRGLCRRPTRSSSSAARARTAASSRRCCRTRAR
jgi:K+/H+ antiporter YhaU regulatory subunit KhtT